MMCWQTPSKGGKLDCGHAMSKQALCRRCRALHPPVFRCYTCCAEDDQRRCGAKSAVDATAFVGSGWWPTRGEGRAPERGRGAGGGGSSSAAERALLNGGCRVHGRSHYRQCRHGSPCSGCCKDCMEDDAGRAKGVVQERRLLPRSAKPVSLVDAHPLDAVLPDCAQDVVSDTSPLRHACATLRALERLGGGGLHTVAAGVTPWTTRLARLDAHQRTLDSSGTFHELDGRLRRDLGGLVGHAILLVLSAIMGPVPDSRGSLANAQALFDAGCAWLTRKAHLSPRRTDESATVMGRLVNVCRGILSAQPTGAVATKVVKAVVAGVGVQALNELATAIASDRDDGASDDSSDNSGSGSDSEIDSDCESGVQGGDGNAEAGEGDGGSASSDGDDSGSDASPGDGARAVASAPSGLSRRQRANAYRYLSLLLAGQAVVEGRARGHRERPSTSDDEVARMVSFALSSGNTSTLSWGYRTVKTGSGTTIIPRIVRMSAYRSLYKRYVESLPIDHAAGRPSFTSFYRVTATLAPTMVSVRACACAHLYLRAHHPRVCVACMRNVFLARGLCVGGGHRFAHAVIPSCAPTASTTSIADAPLRASTGMGTC